MLRFEVVRSSSVLWKAEVGTYGGSDEPSVWVGLQTNLGPSSYRAGAPYGGLEES